MITLNKGFAGFSSSHGGRCVSLPCVFYGLMKCGECGPNIGVSLGDGAGTAMSCTAARRIPFTVRVLQEQSAVIPSRARRIILSVDNSQNLVRAHRADYATRDNPSIEELPNY